MTRPQKTSNKAAFRRSLMRSTPTRGVHVEDIDEVVQPDVLIHSRDRFKRAGRQHSRKCSTLQGAFPTIGSRSII